MRSEHQAALGRLARAVTQRAAMAGCKRVFIVVAATSWFSLAVTQQLPQCA
jgi:hypothetical protein